MGAAAKLVPVSADHPTDVFRSTPTGPPVNPAGALLQILENTDPTQPDAPERLIPTQIFLEKSDAAPALSALRLAAREKWKTYLSHTVNQINPNAKTALRDILVALGYVQTNPYGGLSENERRDWATALVGKLNTHVQAQADALQPNDPAYLYKWRTLKGWQSARWYADYCSDANPLKKIAAPITAIGRNTIPFSPGSIQLTGSPWKHAFVPITGAKTGKFPWWIPVAGVPVAGGAAYLLLRDKGGATPLPTLPVATPDAISLTCGGQGPLNVLANDTGEGITVTGATGTTGVSVAVSGATSVVVTHTGAAGVFTATYTIADQAGQTATGSIVVTVSDQMPPVIVCPPATTLEGCGQPPAPALSGQATATDDCDPAPTVGFLDEFSGSVCHRVIFRTWTAAEASGKTATCSQTITVQDQTAPAFTLCPPPVTVPLGQQNDLSVTGLAAATDACAPPVIEPVFVDDLSGFGTCGGMIVRNWTATDD